MGDDRMFSIRSHFCSNHFDSSDCLPSSSSVHLSIDLIMPASGFAWFNERRFIHFYVNFRGLSIEEAETAWSRFKDVAMKNNRGIKWTRHELELQIFIG